MKINNNHNPNDNDNDNDKESPMTMKRAFSVEKKKRDSPPHFAIVHAGTAGKRAPGYFHRSKHFSRPHCGKPSQAFPWLFNGCSLSSLSSFYFLLITFGSSLIT